MLRPLRQGSPFKTILPHSKRETLNQMWFDAGLASRTVEQHEAIGGLTSRICLK